MPFAISKMAKKYEAVSPDIRGKITAYKYVLSESLCRATERSSFGNPLRSFATPLRSVYIAPNRFVQRVQRARTHAVPLYCARQREKKRRRYERRRDRSVRQSSAVELYPGCKHAERDVRKVFFNGRERIRRNMSKEIHLSVASDY